MLRRLGVLLIVVLGVLVPAGSVQAADTTNARPACELLPPADAKKVLGADVSELFPGRLASLCSYGTADLSTTLSLLAYAGPRSSFKDRPDGEVTRVRLAGTRGWSMAPTPHTPSVGLVMYRDGYSLTVLAKGTSDDLATAKKAMRSIFSKL